jgi:hypothetical protein
MIKSYLKQTGWPSRSSRCSRSPRAGFVPPELAIAGAAIGAIRPFPIDPKLTAVAIAYRNPDVALIADEVLPITPVPGVQAPGLRARERLHGSGSEGRPQEQAERGRVLRDEVLSKCEDYGLDDLVPNEDIEADNQGVDPLGTATMFLTNLVNLAREQRVANLVFNAATYPAGNQATLAGVTQWSDQVNSDPGEGDRRRARRAGDASNIAYFGQATWTALRRHPKIVQAVYGTAQNAGMVSRQGFADLFELQQVLVGQGFLNTAKKGQAVTTARVWGKHAAFIYRDRAAGPQAGVTFGYNGRFGDKIAGTIDEPKIGLKGCQRVRVGERTKEVISANDLAYFFQNAVA